MLDGLILEEIKKITLAKTTKDYAFKVLDPAVIPLERAWSSKKVSCFIWNINWICYVNYFNFLKKVFKKILEK